VLEDVFDLAFEGGGRAPANEVTAFEQMQVRLEVAHELVDGAGPEHPPDDRSGLQCRFLGLRE
jgi:hypothetical protein